MRNAWPGHQDQAGALEAKAGAGREAANKFRTLWPLVAPVEVPERPPAVGHALLGAAEVVGVASAAAVCEQLAATELLVEVEARHVARADAGVLHLGARV